MPRHLSSQSTRNYGTLSFSKCIKAFILFMIAQSQSVELAKESSVISTTGNCSSDCDYNFTSSFFSDGTNTYLVNVTDEFESCGDTAQTLYNNILTTADQIKLGQLCQGFKATPPYPLEWKLLRQDVNVCINTTNSSCFAVNFYSQQNATVNTIFVNCSENAFGNYTQQFQNSVITCQSSDKHYFDLDYLWFLSVLLLFGFAGNKNDSGSTDTRTYRNIQDEGSWPLIPVRPRTSRKEKKKDNKSPSSDVSESSSTLEL